MGKKPKRTLTLCVSIVLVATMFAAANVTTASAADPAYKIADACDDLYAWELQMSGGTMSIDNNDYQQGAGSLFVDMPADDEGLITTPPFAMMLMLTLDDAIDTVALPYCDLLVEKSITLPSRSGLQVNLVDLDVANADGINANLGMDYAPAGWARMSFDSSAVAPAIASTDRTNIKAMRISWLCYSDNNVYYKCDFHIDGIMFYNKEFKDARTAEETRVKGLVDALTTPTQENYQTEKDNIFAVVDAVQQGKTNYPNFMIENQTNLDNIVAAYYGFAKTDEVAATVDLINAIGDVTATNYTEKLPAIEAAEAKVAQLKELYGDTVTEEISNIATLEAARTAYDGFKKVDDDKAAAAAVVTEINALPLPTALVVADEAAVVNARTHYDALTDAQKAYVTTETVGILEAAETQMYTLLHPYTLGDIDENGSVTANDALLALQHSVQKITLEGNKLLAADVDGNGKITANDALLILQYSVHKITKFPADTK